MTVATEVTDSAGGELALTLTIVQVLGALFAALIAVAWTVSVQRRESLKQRHIAAASNVMINSFQVVRYCHRDANLMRDYDSKLGTSLRAWSIDLLHQDSTWIRRWFRGEGRAFLEEALQWRARLQKDALEIANAMEADCGDLHVKHQGPELSELWGRADEFANYIAAWAAEPRRRRRMRLVEIMTESRRGWRGSDKLPSFLHTWPSADRQEMEGSILP